MLSRLTLGSALALGLFVACSSSSSDAPSTQDGGATSNNGGDGDGDGDGDDGGSQSGGNAGSAGQSNGGNDPEDGGVVSGDDAGGSAAEAGTGNPMNSQEDCSGATDTPSDWELLDSLDEFTTHDIGQQPSGTYVLGFSGVAFGNGVFVATGNTAGQNFFHWATSVDGRTWEPHEMPVPDFQPFTTSRVHFHRGQFIVFVELWGGGAYIYTSADGASWQATKVTDGRLTAFSADFASSDDVTVTAGLSGDLQSSTDLETFTPHAVDGASYNDVSYGDGLFIATVNGGGAVYTSPDGENWDPIDGLGAPGGFFVEYGNGLWVIHGQGQVYKTSTDGMEFTDATANAFGGLLRHTGGRFWQLAPSSGDVRIAYTLDTELWEETALIDIPIPEGMVGTTASIGDIACGSCTCVIAGYYVASPEFVFGEPYPHDYYSLLAVGSVLPPQ